MQAVKLTRAAKRLYVTLLKKTLPIFMDPITPYKVAYTGSELRDWENWSTRMRISIYLVLYGWLEETFFEVGKLRHMDIRR